MDIENILVIGDGDFSFSKSLAKYVNVNSIFTITSTCYETYEQLISKYSQAENNIEYLKANGVIVKTCIDGTKLAKKYFDTIFDIIIFNFPHRGGKSNIKKNRILLQEFFKSVKESNLLSSRGSVCVSLCQGQAGTAVDLTDRDFGNSWQIEEMAAQSDFYLFDIRKFDLRPFGDYIPTGFRSQEKRFRLEESRTYVFVESTHTGYGNDMSLTSELEIDGQRCECPRWVAAALSNDDGPNLIDTITKDIVGKLRSVARGWRTVVKAVDGYRVTTGNEEPIFLCRSPWQQVVEVINAGCHVATVTHGFCFHETKVRRCLVTVEPLATDYCPDGVIIDYGVDMDILLLGGLKVVAIGTHDYGGGLCGTEAIIVDHHDNLYVARATDLSQYVCDSQNVSVWDSFVSLATVSRHLTRSLAAIFPIPLLPGNDGVYDVESTLRLLSQRRLLGLTVTRDMSFWLPEGCMATAAEMVAAVADVTASVLCDQAGEGAIITATENEYVPNDGNGRRSLCVRMSMRAGLRPLSRATINQLQTAVRLHCQRTLKVVLR